ncbi:hypothetical protein Lbys_2461 [Leadbetterella byssophila DSM 17132]|uniref:Uncharacterized protein n=1 Tax=Leadbetterella byssophila (strain DSM 17132 / JCM 16389 / KACC 11308 / NBRC 106382 / 4M15) TaxID=649349 RepID=E4RXR2_LEAB4|nr:hypothetical protein Lbys_2461 [Leadbetterella byssophila DSM 17132]
MKSNGVSWYGGNKHFEPSITKVLRFLKKAIKSSLKLLSGSADFQIIACKMRIIQFFL